MKRKLAIVGLLVLAFFLLLIIALPFLLDLNRYRDQYLPLLERTLQRKVELGDVRLSLVPSLGLHVKEIHVADDPAFSKDPFLVVPSAEVIIAWKPLLKRRIQVEKVLIHDPHIHLIRSQEGSLNMDSIGRMSTGGMPAGQIPSQSANDSAQEVNPFWGVLAVENLSLSGGLVTVEDRQDQKAPLYQIQDLVVTTESVQWGQTAVIHAEGTFMPWRVPVAIQGQLGPLQPTFTIPHIAIDGNVGQVDWSGKGALAKGILDLDVKVPHLSTDDISTQGPFTKSVGFSEILAHLSLPVVMQSGGGFLSDIRISPFKANLHLGDGLVQVEGEGTPAVLHVQGKAASLSTKDLPVNLPLAQPAEMDRLNVQATIRDGRIDVSLFQAQVFQGTVEGQGSWNFSGTSSAFSTQGTWRRFATEQVQAAVLPSRVSLSGVGDMHWDINGSLDGSSHPQWAGPVTITVGPGQLSGVDLPRVLEEALRMPGLFGGTPGNTAFTNIQVKASGHPQGVRFTHATVESPHFLVQGRGIVGWNQRLNIQGEFYLPPKVSESVTRRYPLAKVALKENRLRMPFVVKGTMQEPVLMLNTQSWEKQLQQRVNQTIEKVLQGDEKDLQELLHEGRDLLRQFLRR